MKKGLLLCLLLALLLCVPLLGQASITESWSPMYTVEPTCTEQGYTVYENFLMPGTLENRDFVPALGHDWSAWEVLREQYATCEKDGMEIRHCSRCGISETRGIPATGHQWGAWVEYPECEFEGSRERQCQACQARESETLPPAGHVWGEWSTYMEADCENPGMKTRYCARCGQPQEDMIDPLGHQWDNGAVTQEPTCKAEGVRTFTCSRCGAARREAIEKTSHQPTKVTEKMPTCTEPGESVTKCAVCGEKLTNPDSIPALGHDWDGGKEVEGPGCETEGMRLYTCSRCGATYDETIPALGGHLWDTGRVTQEPTCTAEGIKTFTCSRCGATREEALPATDHAYQYIPAVDATCTEPGSTLGISCSICGAMLDMPQEIPPLGHDWDEGAVTREAGLLLPGEIIYTCLRCGDTKTEEIPVIDGTRSAFDLLRNIGSDAAADAAQTADIPEHIDPLRIVAQPQDGAMTRYGDDAPALFVEAEGGVEPYSYQWYREGKAESKPSGGNAAIIGNVRPSASLGSIFGSAVATVVNQCTTSSVTIASSMGGYQADGGKQQAFSVTDNAMALNGATGASYTPVLGGVSYFCKVTDAAGNAVYSDSAKIDWGLRIASQPDNANISGKDSVTLYCVAADGTPKEGGAPYDYYWYEFGVSSIIGEGSKFTVSKEGRYYCDVWDAQGMVPSDTVTVYSAEPLAVSGLKDLDLKPEETADLTAQVSGGTPPYAYEWYYTANVNASIFSARYVVEGAAEPTLTVSGQKLGKYSLIVTDAMGATAGKTVTVSEWMEPLTIVKQPEGAELKRKTDIYQVVVEIGDGTAPYTYTLLREGERKDSAESYSPIGSFTVSEPGVYAIRVVDSEGRKATSQYVDVIYNELRIKDYTRSAVIYDLGNEAGILKVEAVGGRTPYTYSWYKISCDPDYEAYQKNDSFITKELKNSEDNKLYVREPFTTWKCVVKDANGDTVVAYPMTVEYAGDELVIIQQPQDVRLNLSEELYSASMTFKVHTNQGHALKYTWERKGDNGWQVYAYGPTLTLQERVTETVHYYIKSGTFRCRVKDLQTGKEVVSKEASVILPELKVEARQDGKNSTTIILKIEGGNGPYTITCSRDRIGFKGQGHVYEDFNLNGHLNYVDGGLRWAEYRVTNVSKHAREWDDLKYNYRYWYYNFTVTDIFGEKDTDSVRMDGYATEYY